MNTPNYTDAINALTVSINGTAREKAAEAARLKARVADEAADAAQAGAAAASSELKKE